MIVKLARDFIKVYRAARCLVEGFFVIIGS